MQQSGLFRQMHLSVSLTHTHLNLQSITDMWGVQITKDSWTIMTLSLMCKSKKKKKLSIFAQVIKSVSTREHFSTIAMIVCMDPASIGSNVCLAHLTCLKMSLQRHPVVKVRPLDFSAVINSGGLCSRSTSLFQNNKCLLIGSAFIARTKPAAFGTLTEFKLKTLLNRNITI